MFTPVKQDIGSSGRMDTPAYTTTIELDRYIPSKFNQGEKLQYGEQVSAQAAFTYNNPINAAQLDQVTIDDFRVGNRVQKTYSGRLKTGQYGSVGGVHGKINKNRVETSFELGKSRFFTTVGQKVNNVSEYNYDNMQPTTRQAQNVEYYGSAGPNTIKSEAATYYSGDNSQGVNAQYKDSTKNQLRSDYTRGVGVTVPSINDFGKGAYNLLNLERDTTNQMNTLNIHQSNAGTTVHYPDSMKTTGKESLSSQPQVRTNISPMEIRTDAEAQSAGLIGNNLRDTQKESLIHNKYKGVAQQQGPKNAKVYSTYKDPIKIRYAAHAQNYKGPGNDQTGGEHINRNQYNNANISDLKEVAISGQRPAGGRAGASGGITSGQGHIGDVKLTGNMLLKEDDVSYIGQKQSNTMNAGTEKSIIGRIQSIHNDNSEIEQTLNGELVTDQLHNNPFYNIKRTY
jgi:hypothetical protein